MSRGDKESLGTAAAGLAVAGFGAWIVSERTCFGLFMLAVGVVVALVGVTMSEPPAPGAST